MAVLAVGTGFVAFSGPLDFGKVAFFLYLRRGNHFFQSSFSRSPSKPFNRGAPFGAGGFVRSLDPMSAVKWSEARAREREEERASKQESERVRERVGRMAKGPSPISPASEQARARERDFSG